MIISGSGSILIYYIYDGAHLEDVSVYDAFGYRRAYSNAATYAAAPPDGVGYGGQWGNYTDVDTGLILMTFRHYDPSRCRFLTRDPMGYEGGINLYAYCRNNPINRFDPLGLDWLDDISNFSAGWGDALTFNATALARQGLGADSIVDKHSGMYLGGMVVGTVHQELLFRGAGKALAARRAAKAVEAAGAATKGIAAEAGLFGKYILKPGANVNAVRLETAKRLVNFVRNGGKIKYVGYLERDGRQLFGQFISNEGKGVIEIGSGGGNLSTFMEELLHYQQAKSYGFLGKTFQELGLNREVLEAEVEFILKKRGFMP